MSEQETYYTVNYGVPDSTAHIVTQIKAKSVDDAKRKVKRDNPKANYVEAWSE